MLRCVGVAARSPCGALAGLTARTSQHPIGVIAVSSLACRHQPTQSESDCEQRDAGGDEDGRRLLRSRQGARLRQERARRRGPLGDRTVGAGGLSVTAAERRREFAKLVRNCCEPVAIAGDVVTSHAAQREVTAGIVKVRPYGLGACQTRAADRPRPTTNWERRLIRSAGRGDAVAQARLLSLYEPMVRRIARRMFLPGGDRDDLAQEARVGVIDAARVWDPRRGVPFSSFAHLCAVREVRW